MSKLIVLVIGMFMLPYILIAQKNGSIQGNFVDENKAPLIGATVLLTAINKATITNGSGSYIINNIPNGNYELQVSYLGYNTLVDSVKINGGTFYNNQLKVSALNLQEIIISDNLSEQRKRDESLNIEIVNDDYLKQNMGGSIMNSLSRLPGVSTIDIGSGQAKPVIRGLGFNRVAVVENSIKHEAQQWGADHGLEIDQYAVSNVKVIKGPASLMYGSDAIGGVIDMKSKKLPLENSFGGEIDFSAKSNNDFLGSSFSLYGRKSWFFINVRLTVLDYGDYKVPTDSIDIYSYRAGLHKNHMRNTAGKEQNYHVNFGIIRKQFLSQFFISNVNSRYGFFANAHGLEPRNIDTDLHDNSNRDINYPYQKVQHFKAINISTYSWDKLKIETNLGYQRNLRTEWSQYVNHGYMPAIFPDTLSFSGDLERLFEKQVVSVNLNTSYKFNNRFQINVGLNTELSQNRIGGRGFIIPAFDKFALGSFVYGKYKLTANSLLLAGIRYDFGTVETIEYYDWFQSPLIVNRDTTLHYLQRAPNLNRSFRNISWSVGYNYTPEHLILKVNVGKGFRMPTAKELAANGVDYHMYRYLVGNSNLEPEVSYQLDMGIEYHSKDFAIGTSPFLNYFSNYIYLNPTPDYSTDYGAGQQIFIHKQSKVLRYGFEVHSHYELTKYLQFGFIGEYVYSEQLSGEKKGYTLPFSTPPTAVFNIKYKRYKLFKSFENVFASVDYKITASQNNIVQPEEVTSGSQVINFGIGGNVKFKKQSIGVNAQIQNVLNTKYFNHTSYYRIINVPEKGRNIIVNVSIPFSGKFKKQIN